MYPSRNPFPAQATKVIEGSAVTDLDQITLARPSIDRLEELAARYRADYDPSRNDNGRAIAVHGDHGSGKTHALARAMAILLGERPGLSAVRVVYVRADGPDVLALYRKLMQQITLPELRDLCTNARSYYAREEFTESRGLDEDTSLSALGTMNWDGDWVSRAFQVTELQATAVLDRQNTDLSREGMGRKDFERVIPSLLNPDLDELAYRWLTGEPLTETELRRLGITANIEDPLKIRTGIQTLLILSQRAGKPLSLLIDQAEAFVTSKDGSLDQDNAGILRAIVESVPGNSGLLVLAVKEATWLRLPEDLRQRFWPSEIQMTALTTREATDLVSIYVEPWRSKGEPRTFPLLPGGLREVLRNSGGNIRICLQLCSLLFTVAAPKKTPIDRTLARDVLSLQASPMPDKESLREQLVSLLTAAHIPYQARYRLGGVTVDFAITDASGDFRTFIVLTDALFGTEEVQVARTAIDLVQKVQNRSHPAEVVLVVGGYMSPELVSELGEVHRVVVVTPESGRQEIASLVEDLNAPVSAESARLEERLAAVQESLAALEAARARESEELGTRIFNLTVAQGERRRIGELDETRGQWRDAEETIRAEIRAARQKRQKAELDELERLRAESERDRLRILVVGFTLMAVFLATVGGILYSTALFAYWFPGALLGLAVAVTIGGSSAGLLYRPGQARDMARPVGSIEELTRLARAYARRPSPEGLLQPFVSPYRPFRNRNPQLRYAATFLPRVPSLNFLDRALAEERSAINRRSIVKLMAREYSREGFMQVLATAGDDAAASAAFDALKLPRAWELPWPDGTRSELRTLAGIYGFPMTTTQPGLLNQFIQAIDDTRGSSGEQQARGEISSAARDLAHAYVYEDEIKMLHALEAYPERAFRAAADALSPYEAGRLGTFDWLALIEDIDQMYLFFRKCLFYLGRGVTTISQPS